MRYMLLIYADENRETSATKEEQDAWMEEYFQYTRDMDEAGVRVVADALLPTSSATTVRVRDGERVTTHGPFAETREQLGGFYMVDVENLDEAIEWASRCPGARVGSIEVRPILEFESEQE